MIDRMSDIDHHLDVVKSRSRVAACRSRHCCVGASGGPTDERLLGAFRPIRAMRARFTLLFLMKIGIRKF